MQLTFLAAVQRAYRECGFTGTPPASVLNQSGRAADVVDWVLQAHEEIQLLRTDWRWDWAQGTFTLTIADDTYDPTSDFGVVGGVRAFSRNPQGSYAYPTAAGVNARSFMRFLTWEEFQGLQVPVATGSVPTYFTLRPDGSVQYYPVPNVAVTVVHEYWRNPQTLADNADVPRLPVKFHMAIVWKAVMASVGKTKDFARFDTAEEHYNQLLDRMLIEQTPMVVAGGPLA